MRCAKCLSLQLESTVKKTGTRRTLMDVHYFTDSLGHHIHDTNRHRDEYLCSNNHEFFGPNYLPDCPNEKCQWPHVAYEMPPVPPRAPGAPTGWTINEVTGSCAFNAKAVESGKGL